MSGQDVDNWLETVKNGTILPERELRILCEKVKEILIEESNVQPVKAPVTICGDIHGQFLIFWNFSIKVVKSQTRATFSWEIS